MHCLTKKVRVLSALKRIAEQFRHETEKYTLITFYYKMQDFNKGYLSVHRQILV